MNDTNDTNDNNNNDARETIERYGYERYGMNDTNDYKIASTPDARHIWYITYY